MQAQKTSSEKELMTSIALKSTNEEVVVMIDKNKFAIASSLCAGLLWLICTGLVVLFPQYMLQMTMHMIHVDLINIGWTLTWSGFLFGLLGWVILAGATGALLAVIYSRLVGREVH